MSRRCTRRKAVRSASMVSGTPSRRIIRDVRSRSNPVSKEAAEILATDGLLAAAEGLVPGNLRPRLLGPDGDDHRGLRLGDVPERTRGQVAADRRGVRRRPLYARRGQRRLQVQVQPYRHADEYGRHGDGRNECGSRQVVRDGPKQSARGLHTEWGTTMSVPMSSAKNYGLDASMRGFRPERHGLRVRRIRGRVVLGLLRGAAGTAESASWAVFPDAVDRLLRGPVFGAGDCRSLDLELTESAPDHSTLSRTRRLIDVETRDTGESYEAFIRGLAEASGVETPTRADLARFDRSRNINRRSGLRCERRDEVLPAHAPTSSTSSGQRIAVGGVLRDSSFGPRSAPATHRDEGADRDRR